MVYQIENIIFILKMNDEQQHLCLGKYSIDTDHNIETFKNKIKEDHDYIEFYLLSKISNEKYNLLCENLKFDYNITLIEPEKEKSLNDLIKEIRMYEPSGYPFESKDESIYMDLYDKYITKSFDDYCEKNEYNEYELTSVDCSWEETSERYHHNIITTLEFGSNDNYIKVNQEKIIYDDGVDTQHNIKTDINVKVLDYDDEEINEIKDKKLLMLIQYLKDIYY